MNVRANRTRGGRRAASRGISRRFLVGRRHRRAGMLMPRVVTAAACGAAQSGIVRARSSGGEMSVSAATVALGAKLGCNRPVVTLDRRLQVPFLENNVCPTGNSPDNAFSPEGDHDTPNLAPMAATLRAPVRAALASSSRARIVTRHSSRCPRAVSAT